MVNLQGVPAIGVIDSGSDITIMNGELFAKVAISARLRRRELKKADKVPRNFSLDGRLDLTLEFDGKYLCTPVYVRKGAQDQLLLSEGVCHQLGIISYHPEVRTAKQLIKDPHPAPEKPSEEAWVPLVRVCLVKTVHLLPHQSITAPISLDVKKGEYGL